MEVSINADPQSQIPPAAEGVQSRHLFDFVRAYATYADILETPRVMHEAVGIQLLASTLNRNGVTIQLGGLPLSLDLWIVLLSGSGGGRTTTVSLAQRVLQAAELENLVCDAHWGSPQAAYQQLAEQQAALLIWGEMAERLKALNDSRFAGTKQWLTDRYDNFRTPDTVIYRTTGMRERDTPRIAFSGAPRINILATSSEAWFFENLVEEDSSGGFLPRWLLVRTRDTGRVIPVPRIPDESLVQPLADHLRRVSELRGSADLSQIVPAYSRWYEETKERFESQPNRDLASAYFKRHRAHILKLAVVFEVSASGRLQVSLGAWRRAVVMARQLEETIVSLLATGMTGTGHLMDKIRSRIRDAGPEGISHSDITRAFQNKSGKLRGDLLATLVTAREIHTFTRTTAGRPAHYLVHNDFVEEYRVRHPGDPPFTPPARR